MDPIRLGAFIITHERGEILRETIRLVLDQTIPPEKILIVDNSESDLTENIIREMQNPCLEYHRVGYNAGPAGGAAYGLKTLAQQGYDWIYWGDDDDPPPYPDLLADVLAILKTPVAADAGILGYKGGRFRAAMARTLSLKNNELHGIRPVDFVSGNQHMIVNAEVVRKGVLPSAYLFFGFEELDYCLKVRKQTGMNIYVNGDLARRERLRDGKIDPGYRWKGSGLGKENVLWRQYFSCRNLLHILVKNGHWVGFAYYLSRMVARAFAGFRFGRRYGILNLRVQALGIYHFCVGKYGNPHNGFMKDFKAVHANSK